MNRVFVVGMMGAGKSTTGRLLAERLGWDYLDTDECIERDNGQPIPELFKARGERAFRAEETRVLASLGSLGPTVVSVGGGSVEASANRSYLREGGVVVWLRAGVPALLARLGDGSGRPMLQDDPRAHLARLCAERAGGYEDVADVIVDVDGLAPAEVVAQVEAGLAAVRQESRRA